MSRFGGLTAKLAEKAKPATEAEAASAVEPVADSSTRQAAPRAKAREGKKPIIGYFSEDLSRELKILSVTEGKTMQGLLGEALDLLMRDRGKHPFGER